MKKLIFSMIFIISIALNILLCIVTVNNSKAIKSMEQQKADENLKDRVAERVKEKQYFIADEEATGDEAKREIVKNLFPGYFTSNIKALTDYRITKIEISETKDDKFIADIKFDVQCTEGENYWMAGYGEIADGNWVIGKYTYMEVTKNEDKYTAKFVANN